MSTCRDSPLLPRAPDWTKGSAAGQNWPISSLHPGISNWRAESPSQSNDHGALSLKDGTKPGPAFTLQQTAAKFKLRFWEARNAIEKPKKKANLEAKTGRQRSSSPSKKSSNSSSKPA